MRDIYLPNLLRVENFKEIMNAEARISYFMDYDLDDNLNFSVMLKLALANILENYIIFDKVYIDLLEFPIILKELSRIDIKSTIDLIKSNCFSYIDIPDLRVGTQKNDNGFNLVAFRVIKENPKNVEELCDYLSSFFKKEDSIDIENFEKLKPYIVNIFLSRKYNNNLINVEELVKTIDLELKIGHFQKIGIGGFYTYCITDRNKEIYNAICRLIRNEYVTSKLGIFTYYTEDIIEEISKIRYNKYFNYDKDFAKISNLNKIPDFKKMFLEGRLLLKDIIKLKNQRSLKSFQEWLFKNSMEGKDIEQEFTIMLKDKLKGNLPLKVLRFGITNAFSLIPGVGTIIGFGVGAIDSFAIDSFLEKKSTVSFVDKYNEIISTQPYPDYDKLSMVTIPIKSIIPVDNTIITKDEECNNVIEKLKFMESQIDFSNIEFTRNLAENAQKIARQKWSHSIVLERFLHFNHILTVIYNDLSIISVQKSEYIYKIFRNQKGFEFVKSYYFQGYYNLQKNLKSQNKILMNNTFLININEEINKEYKEYINMILKVEKD